MTDSPLLIIKENINCDNFLNKDRFNFLIEKVNYRSLTNFPIVVIDERLYGKALFYIILQNEIYSIAYRTNRIIIDLVKILNCSHFDTNRLHYGYANTTTTQQEHKRVQEKICFIIDTLNFKDDFLIKHFKEISQKDIGERILKMNLKEALHENVYSISRHNPFPKTQLQTTMSKRTSQADMKGKGKAPALQPKQF